MSSSCGQGKQEENCPTREPRQLCIPPSLLATHNKRDTKEQEVQHDSLTQIEALIILSIIILQEKPFDINHSFLLADGTKGLQARQQQKCTVPWSEPIYDTYSTCEIAFILTHVNGFIKTGIKHETYYWDTIRIPVYYHGNSAGLLATFIYKYCS